MIYLDAPHAVVETDRIVIYELKAKHLIRLTVIDQENSPIILVFV